MDVIINADDFGYSKVFNAKMLELLERGVIRSVTVLVDRLDSAQSGQVSELKGLHDTKGIGVGIEIEFKGPDDDAKEIRRQYEKFIGVFGFRPSHFNIHTPKALMEMPNSEKVLKSLAHKVLGFAREHDLPMNNDPDYGIGNFNGVRTTEPVIFGLQFSLDELKDKVRGMKQGRTYEIIFHPGEYDPDCASSLNRERKVDYDKAVMLREFIDGMGGINVTSYLGLKVKDTRSRSW